MSRARSFLALVLITVLLAACQAGNEEPENVAPTLVESDPADGANGVVEQIRLEFSEPMDRAALELTLCTDPSSETDPDCLELSHDVLVWSEDDTVATWGPANTFAPATAYTLQIHAADLAGAVLDTAIGFTTAEAVDDTPPQVLTHSTSIDVFPGVLDLTLVFSEPMDRSTVALAFTSDPFTTCTWTWLVGPEPGQESGVCRTSILEQHTEYRFVINMGAADLAGNGLAAPFTLDLEVGNLVPKVVSITPPDGARFVGPKTPIVVTFNETVFLDGEWLVSTAAGTIPGVSSGGTTTSTLTFTPDGSYGDGALVTWELVDVGDEDVIALVTVTGSFTTRPVATPTGGP